MMHEGAVRVMAEGAGGRTLPVPGGTACGGVVMAPWARPQRRKAQGGRLKGYTGFSLTGRKLSERRESVKGTVETTTDFTGATGVTRAESQERDGGGVESRRAPV